MFYNYHQTLEVSLDKTYLMGTVCLSARHLVGGIFTDSSESVRCEVHISKSVNNPNPFPILFPLVPPVK